MRHDPLLFFMGAGLLLAVLQAKLDDRVVVVGGERIAALADAFTEREGREPSDAQVRSEVDQWVDQELALRQARSLRLGEGDPVIRRRLLQKVALLDETSAPAPASVEPRAELRVALEHRFEGAFAHGNRFSLRPHQDYVEIFGAGFAEALVEAPVGEWTTIQSRYGQHEVLVTERVDAEEPVAPLQAAARLEARDEGRAEARQQRREGVWVLY